MSTTAELFHQIMESDLFRTNGQEIDLCQTVKELCLSIEAEDETNWYEGEGLECTLGDFLVGAFWAFTECHEGQNSLSYEILCQLGSIYSPGMTRKPENSSELVAYEMIIESLTGEPIIWPVHD